MTQVFAATDPDVAGEIFCEQYTAMRMRVHGNGTLLRLALTQVGRARVDRTTFSVAVEGSADPLEAITIVRVRSGTLEYTQGDVSARYGPGDTCFPIALGRPWTVKLQHLDSDVIGLEPALLSEVAGVEAGDAPVQLLSNRPHSPRMGELLWRLSDALTAHVRGQTEAWSSPLVVDSAARLLAGSTLAVFPNTAIVDPTIEDRHDAHPATVRRAVAFIEAHPDRPMSVVDIAYAAHVTPRAIQLAFRRHLGTTPMAYLRLVRLERANVDLLAADPATATVAAIAARWGFADPERFASFYRRTYGRPPWTTLEGR